MRQIIFTVYRRHDGTVNERRAVSDLTNALQLGILSRREVAAICRAIKSAP